MGMSNGLLQSEHGSAGALPLVPQKKQFFSSEGHLDKNFKVNKGNFCFHSQLPGLDKVTEAKPGDGAHYSSEQDSGHTVKLSCSDLGSFQEGHGTFREGPPGKERMNIYIP